MDQEKVKEYSNGEITVIWKPNICIHSEKCWRNLPEVFQPKSRPWIQPEGTDSERIIAQVSQCPSGALSYRKGEESKTEATSAEASIAEVLPNGPLMIHGHLRIKTADGKEVIKENKTAFCRCGASANKPYCDGSHRRIGFEG